MTSSAKRRMRMTRGTVNKTVASIYQNIEASHALRELLCSPWRWDAPVGSGVKAPPQVAPFSQCGDRLLDYLTSDFDVDHDVGGVAIHRKTDSWVQGCGASL